MEAQTPQTKLPAQPAVSQPNYPQFFSATDMCRGCKKHKTLCVCALSKWHEIGDQLTPKQERFLRNYTHSEEFFGNGTLSYADAYGYDLENADRTREKDENGDSISGTSQYDKIHKQCSACASRMLSNVRITPHLNRLFNEMLNDERVDRELAKLIVDPHDRTAKLGAIREYNSLRQRITKKIDLTSLGGHITLDEKQRSVLDRLLQNEIHDQPVSA